MGETNSPSVAHVGYNISLLWRVKLKMLTTRLTACVKFVNLTLEWRNIVTHGQLKENLYICIIFLDSTVSNKLTLQ